MNRHPYLRAYLAGIACPTVFLLVVMTAYTIIRYVYNVPIPVERVIMFPLEERVESDLMLVENFQ